MFLIYVISNVHLHFFLRIKNVITEYLTLLTIQFALSAVQRITKLQNITQLQTAESLQSCPSQILKLTDVPNAQKHNVANEAFSTLSNKDATIRTNSETGNSSSSAPVIQAVKVSSPQPPKRQLSSSSSATNELKQNRSIGKAPKGEKLRNTND